MKRAMCGMLLAFTVMWQGLFIGVEQTQMYTDVFKTPNFSMTTMAAWSVGKLNMRASYIQPFNNYYKPVVQIGVSVRIF